MGARVSFSACKSKVTEAPFPGVSEVLGGYSMIRVNSQAEAVEWASRCPASDRGVIEIRQVQELEDFPAETQLTTAAFTDLRAQPQGGK